MLEIVDAVVAAIGAGRTGIRISPMMETWDCKDSDPVALFSYLVQRLAERRLEERKELRDLAGHAVAAERGSQQ